MKAVGREERSLVVHAGEDVQSVLRTERSLCQRPLQTVWWAILSQVDCPDCLERLHRVDL